MKYLPLLSSIEVGDRVVTSGLTGEFPKGLMIGTITRVDKVEGELFQSAEILPDVDLSRLEEVLVVTSVMMPADRKAGTLPNSNGIDQQAGP